MKRIALNDSFLIKTINKMALVYDLKSDLRYIQGAEENAAETITRLLRRKKMTIEEIAEDSGVSIEFVKAIQKRLGKSTRRKL